MAATRRLPASCAAFVLHQYDWSESSLIVDLFTREQGRVIVVAKGAKRPHSQLRPILLPFNRIQVAFGRAARAAAADEPAAEVQTLRSAEWVGGSVMLAGAALFSGFYLNELLLKLLARQDPHPELFDTYAETLPALAAVDAARDIAREPALEGGGWPALRDELRGQAALRAFELRLLQQIGLLPDLSLVSSTLEPVAAPMQYRLSGDAGVQTADAGGDLPGAALIAAQAALQHGSLQALQQACALHLPAWRNALRGLLHYHLGTSRLRTRQLMIELQSLER